MDQWIGEGNVAFCTVGWALDCRSKSAWAMYTVIHKDIAVCCTIVHGGADSYRSYRSYKVTEPSTEFSVFNCLYSVFVMSKPYRYQYWLLNIVYRFVFLRYINPGIAYNVVHITYITVSAICSQTIITDTLIIFTSILWGKLFIFSNGNFREFFGWRADFHSII